MDTYEEVHTGQVGVQVPYSVDLDEAQAPSPLGIHRPSLIWPCTKIQAVMPDIVVLIPIRVIDVTTH